MLIATYFMQSEAFNIMLRYDLSPAYTKKIFIPNKRKEIKLTKKQGYTKGYKKKGFSFLQTNFAPKLCKKTNRMVFPVGSISSMEI